MAERRLGPAQSGETTDALPDTGTLDLVASLRWLAREVLLPVLIEAQAQTARPDRPESALSSEQVAEILQVPERTVRDLAARGELPCIRFGKVLRFPAAAIYAVARGENK